MLILTKPKYYPQISCTFTDMKNKMQIIMN